MLKKYLNMMISKLTLIAKYFGVIGLGCLLIIGFWMRFEGIEKMLNIGLSDGGRDVLIAKRLVEGQASWLTAPQSAGIVPNAPVYYWLLALGYKLGGGINGVVGLHLVFGVGLIWLSYLIGLKLVDKITGLFLASLVTFSPALIATSQAVWQPNLQTFFIGLAIYVWLMALGSKRSSWYFLSPVATLFMLLIYNSVLPLAIFLNLTLFLGWLNVNAPNLQSIQFRLGLDLQTKKFLKSLGLNFLIWMLLTYGIVGYFGVAKLLNLVIVFNNSRHLSDLGPNFIQLLKLSLQTLVFVPNIKLNYFLIAGLTAIVLLIRPLIKNSQANQNLIIYLGFFSLNYLSFGCGMLLPSGETLGWRILAQSYILLIVVALIPVIVFKNLLGRILIYGLILGLLFQSNKNYFKYYPKAESSTHYIWSEIIANQIQQDFRGRNELPSELGIIVKHEYQTNITTQELAVFWEGASVQLALELENPIFQNRVRIVPWATKWSNYLQPNKGNYYLICIYFTPDVNCLRDISDITNFQVKLIETDYVNKINKLELYYLARSF